MGRKSLEFEPGQRVRRVIEKGRGYIYHSQVPEGAEGEVVLSNGRRGKWNGTKSYVFVKWDDYERVSPIISGFYCDCLELIDNEKLFIPEDWS